MAVVGSAQIIVRAITTSVARDVQRGLSNVVSVAGRRGRDAGSAFGDGLASAAFLKLGAILPVIGALGGAVAALAGGFVALSAAIGPAVGSLAALPGLFGAAAQGAIGGALAFSGLGDAIKALGAPAAQAARTAAQNARAQEAAAERVHNAQRAVAAAQRAVAEAAENGARRVSRANRAVTDAEEALGIAREEAARRAEDAAQRVRDAEQNLADEVEEAQRRREDAAERVADAQQSLADAVENAALRQENADERVADAEERLADARENAALREQDSIRRIENAQRTLADARENAALRAEASARRVESAERTLTQAQETARRVQEDLTRARVDAAERLEDLSLSLARATLNEERAVLAVAEAEERLWEARAEGDEGDIIRADLAYREAIQTLTEVRERNEDLRTEAEAAAEAGVEGSDQVVSALERREQAEQRAADAARGLIDAQADQARSARDNARAIEDATRNLKDVQEDAARSQRDSTESILDAEERLADTQRERLRTQTQNNRSLVEANEALADAREAEARAAVTNARQIADAQRSLIEARQDEARLAVENARSIRDAERSLADAREEAGLAARDAAQANIAAAERLAEAQRDLARAERDAATAGDAVAASVTKINEAMANLSPQAQTFARYIAGLKDELFLLRAAAGEELFPRLQQAIQPMVDTLLPILITRFRETGLVLGNMALGFSALATSPFFAGQVDTILANNNISLQKFGQIAINLTAAFSSLMVAADPLVQRILDFGLALSGSARLATDTAGEVTLLSNKLDVAGNWLFRIGELIGNTFGAIGGVLDAARAPGVELFNSLDATVRRFEEWTNSLAGQSRMREFFDAIVPVVQEVGRLVVDLGAAFLRLAEVPGLANTISMLRTDFLPVIEELFVNATKLAPAIVELATSAAKFVNALAESGIIEVFVGTMTTLLDILARIVQSDIFQNVVAPLLAVGAALKAISLVGNFTGLFAVLGFFQRLLGLNVVTTILGLLRIAFVGLIGVIGGISAPVLIAVGILVALGGALVVLYKKVEGFRKVVDAVVGWVVGAFKWLYNILVGNSIIPDMIKAIMDWFKRLSDTITNIIKSVSNFLTGIWKDIANAVTGLVRGLVDAVIDRFNFWKNFITLTFNAIQTFFKAVWQTISTVVITVVREMVDRVIDRFNFWKNIATAIFNGLREFFSSIFRTIRENVTGIISSMVDAVVGRITSLRDRAMGIFNGLRDSAVGLWNDLRHRVGGIVADFAGNVERRIENLKNTVGRIWDGVRGQFAAPINFVIDRVFNGGLFRAWNAVAGLVNAPRIPDIPRVALARGGVIPGYAPGRDTVPAMLSPGEAVLVPEAVRAIGKERILDWNRRARRGRGGGGRRLDADGTQYFALGGFVEGVGTRLKEGASWAREGVADLGNKIMGLADAVAGAIKDVLDKTFDPLRRLMDGARDTPFGVLTANMGHSLIGKILSFAAIKDKEFGGDLGTGIFNKGVGYGARNRGVSANTRDMVNAMRAVFGPRGLKVIGTLGERPGPSDHPAGKAIDAMVYKNRELGNQIASWVMREGHKWGIKYLIWYERITHGKSPGWRPYLRYRDQPRDDTLQHRDHPHISLLDRGGWLEHGVPTLALNMTGKREAVMPQDIMRAEIRKEFENLNVPLIAELRALRKDMARRESAVYLEGSKVGEFVDQRAERQYLLGRS